MIVSELIEILQSMPQHLPVNIDAIDYGYYHEDIYDVYDNNDDADRDVICQDRAVVIALHYPD